MATKKERSVEELYRDDPDRADAEVFGRKAAKGRVAAAGEAASRRGFLGGAGLAAMSAAVGGPIVYSAAMPGGLVPAALAQGAPAAPGQGSGTAAAAPAPAAPAGPQPFDYPGKARGLMLLQDRPLVAETPEHMLDDATTPTDRFFVRNNGQIAADITNPDAHAFVIDGEVNAPLRLTVGELKSRYRAVTYRLQMECGGNGRSFFSPQARGNQWGNGAIGCAEWTGVPLRDLLRAAGLKDSARFTGNYGADPHLSGDTSRQSISRGMPIAKALERHTLVAFAMNGQPIPHIHGGPVRLITPGWPGSLSHKWLTRIWIRDKPHDGAGMGGTSYRVPIVPIVPGSNVDGRENFADMTSMPLRSILTSHANGTRLAKGTRSLDIRGAAWAGDLDVQRVHVSTNFGQTWKAMRLAAPKNRYDWRRWSGSIQFPTDGYYEVWVRGQDSTGKYQPHTAGNWNPQGYGANSFHRIAMLIG